MDNLLDGAQVAAEIRAEVAREVGAAIAAGARPPGLTAVLVGDDPASKLYVGMKAKACEEVGMVGRTLLLPGSTGDAELAAEVDRLNADDAVDGILIQLPLPKGIREKEMLARVDPDKDVDGFHPVNVGRLWMDEPGLTPATPTGILELLRRRGIEISGKRAVVVGRSVIVGKPMAALLLRHHATVTLCHSRTRDLAAVCREADILVAATGKAELIGPEHVKPGAVVIDVGTNRVTDRATVERLFPGHAEKLASFEKRGSLLVGDVDFTRVQPIAGGITPVPGGVGPLTVALLLVNTWKASRQRQGLPGR